MSRWACISARPGNRNLSRPSIRFALRNELKGFWQQYPALQDSAKAYADHPMVPVSRGRGQITVYDYVALAAKDSALAALFKKHGILPQQVWPIQITVKKVALRKQRQDGSLSSLAEKNIAVAEPYQADLKSAGIEF